MAKRHYRNYGREKRIQKEGPNYDSPRIEPISARGGISCDHEMVRELQVSIHAVNRFAERVLEINSYTMSRTEIWKIARGLRSYLTDNLINESRMLLFDNFYAVINGNIIVTIIKKNK